MPKVGLWEHIKGAVCLKADAYLGILASCPGERFGKATDCVELFGTYGQCHTHQQRSGMPSVCPVLCGGHTAVHTPLPIAVGWGIMDDSATSHNMRVVETPGQETGYVTAEFNIIIKKHYDAVAHALSGQVAGSRRP
jgi:hypothetical protein